MRWHGGTAEERTHARALRHHRWCGSCGGTGKTALSSSDPMACGGWGELRVRIDSKERRLLGGASQAFTDAALLVRPQGGLFEDQFCTHATLKASTCLRYDKVPKVNIGKLRSVRSLKLREGRARESLRARATRSQEWDYNSRIPNITNNQLTRVTAPPASCFNIGLRVAESMTHCV